MIHGEKPIVPNGYSSFTSFKSNGNSVQLKMMVQGKQLSIDSEFSYTKLDEAARTKTKDSSPTVTSSRSR